MFSDDLIRTASRGKVAPRHQIRFTCLGHYRVDVGAGRLYLTFLGQNPDGSQFTFQDCGGQMDADEYDAMDAWCGELNADHEAFLVWWISLTPADRKYLEHRADRGA